jgi:hypothetical protein
VKKLLIKINSTASSEPYCNAGTFVGLGVEAVWCDSTFYSNINMIQVSTTYDGEIGRAFTIPGGITNPLTTSTSVSSTVSPVITTTSTPSISSPTASSTPVPKPNSVGPIVGGVIGGLAFIVAIACATIVFYLRSKRDNREAQNPSYQPPPEIQIESPNGSNSYPQYPTEKYAVGFNPTYVEVQEHAQLDSAKIEQAWPEDMQAHTSNEHGQSEIYSFPGSPTPPYTNTILNTPQTVGELSSNTYGTNDRYELQS